MVPWWPVLFVAGWVLQLAVRLPFIANHRVPILIPDESGYLLAGRLLAGGESSDLSGRALYQGGYPLLVSLAYHISENPATVYQIVLALNALAGSSVFALAYVALRRLDVPRVNAYLVAMVTGFLPSVMYYGQFVLTDAIFPVIVLGWLLCIHAWISRDGQDWGVAAAAIAAYSASVHSRGMIIVVVHAGLLVAVLVRRWTTRRDLVISTGVLAGGMGAGWLLNAWVRSEIYPGGAMPLGDWLFERLTTLDGWGWTLGLVTGKVWYLIVSTWGIAGVGLVAAGVVVARGGVPVATRATACVALAATTGIALATSAAVPDEGTVANFAYGRYLACLAPVFFLAGGAVAMRASRPLLLRAVGAAAALAVVSGLIVRVYAGGRLSTDFFGVFDFPEMSVMTWSWNGLKVGWATLAVLPGLAALLFLKYRRVGPVLGAAIIAANLIIVVAVSERIIRYWGNRLHTATSLAPARLTANDVVAIDYRDMPWRIWVSQAFQAHNHLVPIDRFNAATLPSRVTLVVVPWRPDQPARKSWPAAPRNFRLTQINWTDTGAWAAWRRTR
ncbi:hypothetical protein ACFY4C_31530 [Actinomadura viridis]|uniref:hypothetical protein n=1 Tax=Actinomadura viridis TaxID=58110 RepID=UPI0036A7F0FD